MNIRKIRNGRLRLGHAGRARLIDSRQTGAGFRFIGVLRCIFALVVTVLLALPLPVEAVETADGVRITIVHTNDTHTRIKKGDDFGKAMGWAQLTAAIRKEREQNPDTLVLDAGDTFHGLPIVILTRGANMVPLLNLAGYDAMCPGNHEFDYGADRLMELAKSWTFPRSAPMLPIRIRENSYFPPIRISTCPV